MARFRVGRIVADDMGSLLRLIESAPPKMNRIRP